jgi:hypothetical protein
MNPTHKELLLHSKTGAGPARCDCTIFEDETASVVVLTELPDNPGRSVTNAIEEIANLVREKHPDVTRKRVTWVEHYPSESRGGEKETFDLVFFAENNPCRNPRWQPYDRPSLERRLGQPFA